MAGCSENESPIDNGNQQHHFTLEVEPVLSPDGAYVYYVGLDTLDLERSSVLRARVLMPVREDLQVPGTLARDTSHSPTISPSLASLAYLDESLLYECAVAGGECTGIEIGSFYAAAYVGDSLLALATADSIYLAGIGRTSHTFLINGWDPRTETDSSIVCVTGSGGLWRIILAGRVGVIDTLFLHTGERPRWPDLDEERNLLAYSVQSMDSFLVLVADLSAMTLDTVATTRHPRVCLAGPTLLLLTGPNGLLHQVSPRGGTPQPWVHVEDPD